VRNGLPGRHGLPLVFAILPKLLLHGFPLMHQHASLEVAARIVRQGNAFGLAIDEFSLLVKNPVLMPALMPSIFKTSV